MGTISDGEKKIFLERPSKEWTYEYITSLVSDKYDKKSNKECKALFLILLFGQTVVSNLNYEIL